MSKNSLTRALLLLPILSVATVRAQAPVPDDSQVLAWSLNRFGSELCQKASKADAAFCLSPASVSQALLMVLAGAAGTTQSELQKALAPAEWPSERIHAAAGVLLAGLRAPGEGVELAVANDLWPQQGEALRADYTALLQKHYHTELRPQDFRSAAEAARKAINDHVAEVTHQRILDLLAAGSVPADTRLILTNALYFKARWLRPFDPNNTRNRPFQLPDGQKADVPMMSLRGKFHYAATDTVQVLRLPYAGEAFALDLALPVAGQPLAAADAALRSIGAGTWPGAPAFTDVQVALPKFRIESRFLLRGPLEQLGLRTMFGRSADFSAIDDGKGALRVDQVVHKTFLEVGEQGTEAAAATAVRMRTGAARPPQELAYFTADRPFGWQLIDLRSGLVLFAGRTTDPRPVTAPTVTGRD